MFGNRCSGPSEGTLVPLLAVTQALNTTEQLTFLVGPLAARPWCHSKRRSPRAWWGCGRDTWREGPQGKCWACLSFEHDKGGGEEGCLQSLRSLLSLHTSAMVNYRCWDTVPQGAEGGPWWHRFEREESRSRGETAGRLGLGLVSGVPTRRTRTVLQGHVVASVQPLSCWC